MDKIRVAKAVVNNLVGYGVGALTGQIVKEYIPRHENPIINTVIGASIITTSWALSGTIAEPVRSHTDRKIDEIATSLANVKNSLEKN